MDVGLVIRHGGNTNYINGIFGSRLRGRDMEDRCQGDQSQAEHRHHLPDQQLLCGGSFCDHERILEASTGVVNIRVGCINVIRLSLGENRASLGRLTIAASVHPCPHGAIALVLVVLLMIMRFA